MDVSALLKRNGLKDTQPRRSVLGILVRSRAPLSVSEIQKTLSKRGDTLNAVTVYRVLASLHHVHLVHKYPCNGGYGACTLPGSHGHHVLTHCHSCGSTQEFLEPKLCRIESSLAEKAGLTSTTHFSELCGTCDRCSS